MEESIVERVNPFILTDIAVDNSPFSSCSVNFNNLALTVASHTILSSVYYDILVSYESTPQNSSWTVLSWLLKVAPTSYNIREVNHNVLTDSLGCLPLTICSGSFCLDCCCCFASGRSLFPRLDYIRHNSINQGQRLYHFFCSILKSTTMISIRCLYTEKEITASPPSHDWQLLGRAS